MNGRYSLRSYPDVPEGHWLRPIVLALLAKGYTEIEAIEPDDRPDILGRYPEVIRACSQLRVHPAVTEWDSRYIDGVGWLRFPCGWATLYWSGDDDAAPLAWVATLPDVSRLRLGA